MSSFAVLRNPHFLNYLVGSLVCVTPVLYYAYSYTPDPLELGSQLVRAAAAQLRAAAPPWPPPLLGLVFLTPTNP